MGDTQSKPWREIGILPNPETWTVEVEDKLRGDCKNGPDNTYSLGSNKVKILMLGPTQNGKSSLVNSFFSALNKRINQYVLAASSDHSVTRTLVSPKVRVEGQELKFKLTDMPGIFACQSHHVNEYVEAVLNGRIKEDEEVPHEPLDKEADYYIENPGPFDRPCCVVLVMRAGRLLANDIKERFQSVIQVAGRLHLKVAVVLTHVDNLADQQASLRGRNTSRIFHDEKVHEVVRQASAETGIPIGFIHPVVNYSLEVETVTEMNILHLFTLSKILDMAGEGANARSP